MPPWLRAIAHFDPPTCLVDALRGPMVPGEPVFIGSGVDFLVPADVFSPLKAPAVRLCPGLVR